MIGIMRWIQSAPWTPRTRWFNRTSSGKYDSVALRTSERSIPFWTYCSIGTDRQKRTTLGSAGRIPFPNAIAQGKLRYRCTLMVRGGQISELIVSRLELVERGAFQADVMVLKLFEDVRSCRQFRMDEMRNFILRPSGIKRPGRIMERPVCRLWAAAWDLPIFMCLP